MKSKEETSEVYHREFEDWFAENKSAILKDRDLDDRYSYSTIKMWISWAYDQAYEQGYHDGFTTRDEDENSNS